MTTSTNQPTQTLRDGSLKATIWNNPKPLENGETRNFYSVQISRTYQDDQGTYHNSDNFSKGDLLRVARLAQKAYDVIEHLNARKV